MTLYNNRFAGKKFAKGKMTNYFYMESAVKQSIQELLDTKKLYSGTNEWVVNVNDINEIFGKELTTEGGIRK